MSENLSLFETTEHIKTHEFGGIWTKDKLDALKQYLNAFTTAMHLKSWCRTIYIDAFAGTGECDIQIRNQKFTIAGSARLGLETDPAFDSVVFIENDKKRYQHLLELKRAFPEHQIAIYHGDANTLLPKILSKHLGKNHRGVIFIDPYGMNIEWETLESVAKTRHLDVWYLFPLSGFYRQAAKYENDIDDIKVAALNRILGPCDWKSELYKLPPIDDLFGHAQEKERETDIKSMLDIATARLKTLFPYVSSPLVLPKKGTPRFALYFAVSNDSRPAQELARRISNHILRMAG